LSPPEDPPSAEDNALANRCRIDEALSAVVGEPALAGDLALATAFFAVVAGLSAGLSLGVAFFADASANFFGSLADGFFGIATSFGSFASGGATFVFGAGCSSVVDAGALAPAEGATLSPVGSVGGA
jgi:hypothetical protein